MALTSSLTLPALRSQCRCAGVLCITGAKGAAAGQQEDRAPAALLLTWAAIWTEPASTGSVDCKHAEGSMALTLSLTLLAGGLQCRCVGMLLIVMQWQQIFPLGLTHLRLEFTLQESAFVCVFC